MGGNLGQLYYELDKEVSWLHDKWGEFRELFCGGQERIDLLSNVASSFFYVMSQVLYESVILHLCRLTDPPGSTKRPNEDQYFSQARQHREYFGQRSGFVPGENCNGTLPAPVQLRISMELKK